MEQYGKVFTFKNSPDAASPDLFADIKKLHPETTETYSLAFHPKFRENRFVFIWYMLQAEKPYGTKIARFNVMDSDPPRIDPFSEKIVFTWKSGGHNGGAIRFGNDGYMYLGTGDGAGPAPPDPFDSGQDISDLLCSVLRIDIDKEDEGKSYAVPKDNPFLKTFGARPEVWAYGFRNPWRMSVDAETGDLWVGDVGWELWEMIYKVQKGGNYGWSVMEGSSHPVRRDLSPGPTPILPAVVEHPHSEAASITGGIVYRGKQLPELSGSYIYGDYETGNLWELKMEGNKIARQRLIATSRHKISSFGEDAARELYIVDHTGGGLHRLVKNNAEDTTKTFPRKLSESGLFANIREYELASGVLGYDIKAPMWRDSAKGARFAGWPGSSMGSIAEGKTEYPMDAVLGLTYSIQTEAGNPKSQRAIETQILHFSEGRWNPYTYEWNEDQTDAHLVGPNGAEKKLEITDASAPGGKRSIHWRLHSRSECLRCHNSWCGTALAFSREQIGLESWSKLVKNNPPEKGGDKLVNPHDSTAPLTARARSYLHINCSHCHRENAGGSVMSFMNVEMPLQRAGLLGRIPAQGAFGLTDPEVVAPGDPLRSVLYYRISKTGSGHMPYMGSTMVDPEGIELIRQWISSFKSSSTQTAASDAEEKFKSLLTEGASSPHLDEMLKSTSSALRLMRAVDANELPENLRAETIKKGAASQNSLVRDLFDRFLPDSERVQTLGANIDPATILALKGDETRGRSLFFQERSQCATCHQRNGEGKDFGPDLSAIGTKYILKDLLDHILNPSKVIAPEFVPYSIELADDTVHTGFLKSRTQKEIVLREQTGEARFPLSGQEKIQQQKLSLMPEGLLQSWTAQEAADLLEFLSRPPTSAK